MTYFLETLARRFDVRLLGRGKRVFVRLDAGDDKWCCFFPAYIPRAPNNRDANGAIGLFVGKWRFYRLSLWAEPEDIIITATILIKHSII